jgi:hypothetical protein
MRSLLRRFLLIAGASSLAIALAWWALVFRSVVANDYLTLPQAGICLGRSSSLCELAMSLCSARVRHFLDITRYSPDLLWVGLLMLGLGLLLLSAPSTADEKVSPQ